MTQQNLFQNAKIVGGTPYHVDFPDDWINTEHNEQLVCDNVIIPMKTGPRFCGNCLEMGVDENGIFVEYCLNCDDYVYNGSRRISVRSTSVYQRGLAEIQIIHDSSTTTSTTISGFANSTTSGFANSTISGFANSTISGFANSTTSGIANSTTSGIANSTTSGIANSTTSGIANSTTSGIANSTTSGIANSTTSGIANSTTSGIANSNVPLFANYNNFTSDY